MDVELNQLVQAISVAKDPTIASRDPALQSQALEYLTSVQQNAQNTWRVALKLFVESGEDGGRKYDAYTRFFALRILEEFLERRTEPLDNESFQILQTSFVSYIQSEYIFGPAESSAQFIRNKFSHTFALFFLATYETQWQSFFPDIFALIQPPTLNPSTASTSTSSSQQPLNPHVSLLFFRVILEISGEVADNLLKSARTHDMGRYTRDSRVKDTVRAKDASGINNAVLAIIGEGAEKIRVARLEFGDDAKEVELLEEVVDWGVRAFASYIHWIDISLTVTPNSIPLVFSLLHNRSLPIRLATLQALTRMLQKGLKEPSDKVSLLQVLSLGTVLTALEERTRRDQLARKESGEEDEGEESFREGLGRCACALGQEIMELLRENNPAEVRAAVQPLLEEVLPLSLRFLADKYDDTSSTIFPFLSLFLAFLKKIKKTETGPQVILSHRPFLTQLLTVILQKLKWEPSTFVDEEPDEDDKNAFEIMRKDLRTFCESLYLLEPDLVTEAMQSYALNIFRTYESGTPVNPEDAELAVTLVYMYGDVAKNVMGRKAFCVIPTEMTKETIAETDLASFELTSLGHVLVGMIRSGIASYPHPAVTMQFFECLARYQDFFKVRKECIVPVLEMLASVRGIHNPISSMRSRSYYIFYRFLKEIRSLIPQALIPSLIDSIRDTLVVHVELPEIDTDVVSAAGGLIELLSEAVGMASVFDSELYMFESAGILLSLLGSSAAANGNVNGATNGTATSTVNGHTNPQTELMNSLVLPLLTTLSQEIQQSTSHPVTTPEDVIPVLKAHHIIMALGQLCKGFPDNPSAGGVPEEVFRSIAEAFVGSLDALQEYKVIRDAVRSSYAKLLSPSGRTVTPYLPQLMSRLLTHFHSSELLDFMNFISLLVHKLGDEMYAPLEELIGPLHTHVVEMMSGADGGGAEERAGFGETKKGYLLFLNNIMIGKQHKIFTSPRNASMVEPLCQSVLSIAEDITDLASEKAALSLISRFISAWAVNPGTYYWENPPAPETLTGDGVPGFENWVYSNVVPMIFNVPSLPSFNIKDGGAITVMYELGGLLHTICKVRGRESLVFLQNTFFPSIQAPEHISRDLLEKIQLHDNKAFKKYFAEFIKTLKAQNQAS
ncbi:ARM repeat-containing protein [Sistotremastrum suecicum HHB10207 ss-3]|uniref:Exportin-T n=1 Tax=Sistotremastrum suecicum HHB10207 ss-3 TaxID=1314776 RepID=A0A166B7A8_9AGAM|nr:ARM repeat-containing protein [Sistotremastrum suecicum HHB10207 ss-3]